MKILKTFSSGNENIYSVLMSEEELALFSENKSSLAKKVGIGAGVVAGAGLGAYGLEKSANVIGERLVKQTADASKFRALGEKMKNAKTVQNLVKKVLKK